MPEAGNPFAPANSRRPSCFHRPVEIACSLASSGLGSPAAVTERECWLADIR